MAVLYCTCKENLAYRRADHGQEGDSAACAAGESGRRHGRGENRGRKYGFSAFWTLCIAVLIFNGIYDRPNDLPMALMMAYLAAESYPRFAFTRKKSDLVVAILTTIAAAAALAAYVVSVVRGV